MKTVSIKGVCALVGYIVNILLGIKMFGFEGTLTCLLWIAIFAKIDEWCKEEKDG